MSSRRDGIEIPETKEHRPLKAGFLERLCKTVVWILFAVLLLFLTGLSLSMTCTVYGGEEVVRYEADQPLLHFFFWLVILSIGVAFKINHFSPWKLFSGRKRFSRFLLIVAGMYIVWLILTGYWPGSDQRMVFESAQALLRGDYSPWAPEGYRYLAKQGITGYAYTYPSQNGLILFFALVAVLFRDLTPYALQLLNIIFLFAGIIYLRRLFQGIFGEKIMNGTELLMLVFLPFSFYFTFVYGTIPGFACSSAAIYYEYKFLKSGNWKSMAVSSVLVCAAVLLKSNYLIVLVAMVIYLLTYFLFQFKLRFAGAAVLLVVLYLGSGRMMNLYLETVTGVSVDGGIPMLAWVEMGLQEGSRGPGWYNGYNVQVFSDNESNPEATLKAVKEDLKGTVQNFIKDPDRANVFFLKKAGSIWAEPTFQSLWIQEVKGDSWLLPGLTSSLYKEGGILNALYVAFFDYMQTLIYGGTFLFLILKRKNITWLMLLPGVIFIGGFLFHMVWEAKGQYSVCYFILLIPYAVLGLKEAVRCLSVKIHN